MTLVMMTATINTVVVIIIIINIIGLLLWMGTGGDRPLLSSSKLIKWTSLSRLLDAGVGWQQYVDEATPASHADASVIIMQSYQLGYISSINAT